MAQRKPLQHGRKIDSRSRVGYSNSQHRGANGEFVTRYANVTINHLNTNPTGPRIIMHEWEDGVLDVRFVDGDCRRIDGNFVNEVLA